jgi:hypothetical protein
MTPINKIIPLTNTHKKYIWVMALWLFTTMQTIQAQTIPAFIMSSMGSMAGSSNTGMAIQFNSIATCLNVQNGIAVLSGERGNGQFAMNCEVSLKINSLGVKLYPNPVSANVRVKFLNTPPLTDIFNLSIWSSDGILISTRKETGYNLFQGTEIDLRTIVAGTYILKIESTNYIDAVKFIKAN